MYNIQYYTKLQINLQIRLDIKILVGNTKYFGKIIKHRDPNI